ncbi:MAG: hypothetical protein QOD85_2538 [Gaiellaceae bacterium]|nr:hypothetical protein [Gaiellaceae bacterium]
MDGHETAHATVGSLELQAREPVRGGTCAGAAVSVQMHAENSELPQRRRELARHTRLLEPVADMGNDAVRHKGAHGVADVALLVREQVVDREKVLHQRVMALTRSRSGSRPHPGPSGAASSPFRGRG